MRRWRNSSRAAVWATVAAGLFLLGQAEGASAAPCDEADPAGPMRSVKITLSASDFVSEEGDEMRSFVATGSLGRVAAAIVSSSPKDLVRSLVATPEISRFSPLYGEELKGIEVGVTLRKTSRSVRVVVDLRQVCAHYFRNSFLTY